MPLLSFRGQEDDTESDPVKQAMYCLRGEIVSIGGRVEWTVRRLAEFFADSSQNEPKRAWDDLKADLARRGLAADHQRSIQAVSEYFSPRRLAAHAAIFIANVAGTEQILRVFGTRNLKVESITVDDLKREVDTARKGFVELQRIGRALQSADPPRLDHLDRIASYLLVGSDE